jgi:hypothetical protein
LGIFLRFFPSSDVAELAAAYRKARRDALSQSVARVQHAPNAEARHVVASHDGLRAPRRVRAADVVLQATLPGMGVENIEAHLSALEQAPK